MLRLFRELRSLWRSYQDFGIQARWFGSFHRALASRKCLLTPWAPAALHRVQEFAALRRQRELMEAEVVRVRPPVALYTQHASLTCRFANCT